MLAEGFPGSETMTASVSTQGVESHDEGSAQILSSSEFAGLQPVELAQDHEYPVTSRDQEGPLMQPGCAGGHIGLDCAEPAASIQESHPFYFSQWFAGVPEIFQLTVACLRGLGAHRRAQIGPQRSDESRGARTKTRTGPPGGVLRGQACYAQYKKALFYCSAPNAQRARRGNGTDSFFNLHNGRFYSNNCALSYCKSTFHT